jgi:hypothetical protein
MFPRKFLPFAKVLAKCNFFRAELRQLGIKKQYYGMLNLFKRLKTPSEYARNQQMATDKSAIQLTVPGINPRKLASSRFILRAFSKPSPTLFFPLLKMMKRKLQYHFAHAAHPDQQIVIEKKPSWGEIFQVRTYQA